MKVTTLLWLPALLLLVACSAGDKPSSQSKAPALPTSYEECLKCGGYRVNGTNGEMCRRDYSCNQEPDLCELCKRQGFGQYVSDNFENGSSASGCSFRIYRKGNRLAKSNWDD